MNGAGPSPVKSVTVIIDGVTHHGSYFVQDSIVHVRSPLRMGWTGRAPAPNRSDNDRGLEARGAHRHVP
jgi:hypothetical protein